MIARSAMATLKKRIFVIGVGMTKFEKPGSRDDFDYPKMGYEAATRALKDAGVSYEQVQQACVGYVYGESTCGQRVLYELGMTGIPVYNVNNNCSTGSTALFMAKQLVEGGIADCVMALGFEKMQKGSLSSKVADRTNPLDKHVEVMVNAHDFEPSPIAPQMFGNAGREYMKKYGIKPEYFAKIAEKNHRHSKNNPYSQFQNEYTLDEILNSPTIHAPLTKLQCCPTSDGGACAIIASEDFVKENHLEQQAVEILAQSMTTDLPSSFEEQTCLKMVGYDMSKMAAAQAYQQAGLSAEDVDVVELHDCFSTNELLTYEALGLCDEGKAAEFIDRGDNTYGGRYVVNPSGGLISKGHPLGATGLAQCCELTWQLRGLAGKRQVPGAKVGLQHNIGLGGAAVVTIYSKGINPKQYKKQQPDHIVAVPTSAKASESEANDFKVATVFKEIENELKKDGKKYVSTIKGVYCFNVTNGPDGKQGVWIVDAKNGNGSVKYDPSGKGDVTITVSDENLLKVMTGQLQPQQAFFKGQLKIKGNMGLAMKLQQFKINKSKL